MLRNKLFFVVHREEWIKFYIYREYILWKYGTIREIKLSERINNTKLKKLLWEYFTRRGYTRILIKDSKRI